MRTHNAALLAVFLLTACGGGGSSAVSPGTPASVSQQKTTGGSIVLSIPTQTSSSAVRYPQFVSPNASSVSIVVNSGAAQNFDVSATSSLCTTTSGSRNCTLTFGAPPGNDTITLTIFSGPNGTGTTLALTTTTTTVTAGTPFTVTVAVNAAIGTVVATIKNGTGGSCNGTTNNAIAIQEGCVTNGGASLTVVASDPSGAQITGTGSYLTPIQISANDPSLTASPASITAPGQTSALAYSGSPLAQSLGNAATISLTIGTQVVPISVPILRQNLYVTNSNAPPGTTPPGGGNVVVYAFGATGSATPIRTISSGLVNPVFPTLDSSGNLYVLDNGPAGTRNPSILVFAAGTSTLLRTISNIGTLDGNQACESFTFDPTGQSLLLTCDDVFSNGIHVISATTSGSPTQTAALKCTNPSPCFSRSVGITFDPSGNLWVAEAGLNDVFGFSKGSFSLSGGLQNITPSTTLNGSTGTPWPSTVNPLDVVFDISGTMYVDSVNSAVSPGTADANNRVSLWNSSTLASCSSCTPSVALTGTPFTTHAPAGIALDYGGSLYVSNQFNNTISVFTRTTIGSSIANPTALRTIATSSSPSAPTGIALGP